MQRSSSTALTTTTQTTAATPFPLPLALINLSKLIDFSTSEGAKLSKYAIENLPLKFDLELATIETFNEAVESWLEQG